MAIPSVEAPRLPTSFEILLGASGIAVSFLLELVAARSFLQGNLLVALVTHGLGAAVFAAALPLSLPPGVCQPPILARLGLFALGLVLPFIAVVGLGAGLPWAYHGRPRHRRDPLKYVSTPELPLQPLFMGEGAPLRFSEGALSLVLKHAPDPDKRVAAVMALRRMANARATPLLRIALRDPADDVRLLAYALTDGIDKEINRRIQRRLAVLEQTPLQERGRLLKALAQDYWDIAFLGLASADIERHVLGQAAKYLEQTLQLRPDGGAALLLGRVRLRQRRPVDAEAAFARARALGLPAVAVGPYRAEAAFQMRRFDLVHQRLAELPTTSRARQPLAEVLGFWLEGSVT